MGYSAAKRNIVLMPDPVWVDLENIMLHEKRHTHKATYSSLCKNIKSRQIHRNTKKSDVFQRL